MGTKRSIVERLVPLIFFFFLLIEQKRGQGWAKKRGKTWKPTQGQRLGQTRVYVFCLDVCVNDPSAGSPTETLLRLLLPLNDQVWTSFRRVMASPPGHGDHRESPVQDRQSEGLTKSFNR